MHYKIVALIPARGGSQRVNRKNIKLMAGKPMLTWSVEACLKSKYIARTFVSTEDKEIKEIALNSGAEVLDRPQRYASDCLGYELIGIIQQLREYIIDHGNITDYIGLFYPTSPLRKTEWIDGAYEFMRDINCNRCYSAYKLPQGIFDESWILDEYGRAKHRFRYTQEENNLRHAGIKYQEDRYIHTADVNIQRFRECLPYTDIDYSDVGLYVIDKNEVVDVNTQEEFDIAEYLLNKRKNLTK